MRKPWLAKLGFAVLLAGLGGHSDAQERVALNVIISDQRTDTSRPAPVVLALHSQFVTAQDFRAQVGLDRAAREMGVIVAYPQAAVGGWRAADAENLVALIRALRKDPRTLDQPPVVVGHSDGGVAAMAIACTEPRQSAGIGVVGAKTTPATNCADPVPLPAIFLHGTADPIAPHGGSAEQLSAGETLDLWAKRNRCPDDIRVSRVDRNAADRFSAVIRSYRRCQAALEHVQILGAGHGWPTGTGSGRRNLGPNSPDIRAGTQVLAFFRAYLSR